MQTLYNQLIYFAFFQSILLLFVYAFSKKNRKKVNPFLAFMVFTLFIGLVGKTLYISEVFGKNFRLNAFSELAAMLFGITVYLFTRTSLLGKRPQNKHLAHYIPAFGYMGFIVFYFMLPSDAVIRERIATGELARMIYACHAIGLIVNITYWGLSLLQYLRFRDRLKDEFSFTVKTRFFLNFHVIIGVFLLIWLVLYILSLSGFEMLERDLRPAIWVSIALIILFIAYYGMLSPEVFRVAPLEEIRKYAQSKFSATDLNALKEQLEQLMNERKPYLNNKLLKAELAEMLGIPNPELARLLNECIGMNFFEYVNYYRIKEFVSLAQTNKARQLTFFGLAQEAGFNSKTTFNKSFKRLMGTSPSEYFNNQNS